MARKSAPKKAARKGVVKKPAARKAAKKAAAVKTAAKKPAGIGRSAISGRFMSVSSAKAHKKTAIIHGGKGKG